MEEGMEGMNKNWQQSKQCNNVCRQTGSSLGQAVSVRCRPNKVVET